MINEKVWKFIKKYPQETDEAILIIGFILGMNLFLFLKAAGLEEFGFEIPRGKFHWTLPTLAGAGVGMAFAFLEFKVFPYLPQWFPRSAVAKATIRFVISSLCIVLCMAVIGIATGIIIDGYSWRLAFFETETFLKSGIFVSLYLFLMLLSVGINFFRALGNRLGHSILISYALGKYKEPTEEDRVFMFVDLKNSTTIAERLGHTKYSRLLNQCFNDLSALLKPYEAEVYQYVGDEVVITWLAKDLKSPSIPAQLFFEFCDRLQKNDGEYQSKFGWSPRFKAAINTGKVTVTEVGHQRRDLAYHGDVLNTGSRVLALCSQLERDLLVTTPVAQELEIDSRFAVRFVQNLILRGKSQYTSVYGVERQVSEKLRGLSRVG